MHCYNETILPPVNEVKLPHKNFIILKYYWDSYIKARFTSLHTAMQENSAVS